MMLVIWNLLDLNNIPIGYAFNWSCRNFSVQLSLTAMPPPYAAGGLANSRLLLLRQEFFL